MTTDPSFDWVGAMGHFKAGVDMVRGALGLVKDVRDILPDGDKKEAITAAIATSDKQLKLGEAQIAAGLGYQLCRCEFPPTIMLTVGSKSGRAGDHSTRSGL